MSRMTVENWAEIRRLHTSEEMPLKSIVRKFRVSRNAVRRALSADASSKYVRPSKGSSIDMVESQIRPSLTEWPTMPATVVAGPQDHDIRLDSNDCSVHASAVSRLVEPKSSPSKGLFAAEGDRRVVMA